MFLSPKLETIKRLSWLTRLNKNDSAPLFKLLLISLIWVSHTNVRLSTGKSFFANMCTLQNMEIIKYNKNFMPVTENGFRILVLNL